MDVKTGIKKVNNELVLPDSEKYVLIFYDTDGAKLLVNGMNEYEATGLLKFAEVNILQDKVELEVVEPQDVMYG